MEPSGRTVGSIPNQAAGRVVPAAMVLRLQQVVGNREVQRFLFPEPAVVAPPPEPLAPRRPWLGLRFSRIRLLRVRLLRRRD